MDNIKNWENVKIKKERIKNNVKTYAYTIECDIRGEHKCLNGIDHIIAPDYEQYIRNTFVRKINNLKKNYGNVKCIYKNQYIEIKDFLYEDYGKVTLLYEDLESDILGYDFLGDVKWYRLFEIFNQKDLTVEQLYDIKLSKTNLMMLNEKFNKVSDLVKKYNLCKQTVMKFIKQNDFYGLELYTLYKDHINKKVL